VKKPEAREAEVKEGATAVVLLDSSAPLLAVLVMVVAVVVVVAVVPVSLVPMLVLVVGWWGC
jgi:hypothetical protein